MKPMDTHVLPTYSSGCADLGLPPPTPSFPAPVQQPQLPATPLVLPVSPDVLFPSHFPSVAVPVQQSAKRRREAPNLAHVHSPLSGTEFSGAMSETNTSVDTADTRDVKRKDDRRSRNALRQIKNRESAARSRQRKRAEQERVEQRMRQLQSKTEEQQREISQLKHENQSLREQVDFFKVLLLRSGNNLPAGGQIQIQVPGIASSSMSVTSDSRTCVRTPSSTSTGSASVTYVHSLPQAPAPDAQHKSTAAAVTDSDETMSDSSGDRAASRSGSPSLSTGSASTMALCALMVSMTVTLSGLRGHEGGGGGLASVLGWTSSFGLQPQGQDGSTTGAAGLPPTSAAGSMGRGILAHDTPLTTIAAAAAESPAHDAASLPILLSPTSGLTMLLRSSGAAHTIEVVLVDALLLFGVLMAVYLLLAAVRSGWQRVRAARKHSGGGGALHTDSKCDELQRGVREVSGAMCHGCGRVRQALGSGLVAAQQVLARRRSGRNELPIRLSDNSCGAQGGAGEGGERFSTPVKAQAAQGEPVRRRNKRPSDSVH